MFRELWNRWTYVEIVKRITLDESGESFPFPTAEELAQAYNLYPHRREIPFILGRMASILAFDDATSNYKFYYSNFREKIEIDKITERYKDKTILQRYQGAIDPIIYLARVIVDAGRADLASLKQAFNLLEKNRKNDSTAKIHQLIFSHEISEQDQTSDDVQQQHYVTLRNEINEFLNNLTKQNASKESVRLITQDVFQELLDHCAQLHVQITSTDNPDRINGVTQLYARILSMRKLIASSTEVPWFEGPGKLTLFQYFKHEAGRQTNTTRSVMKLFDKLPGLKVELKQRIYDAEAFKDFRALEFWYRGTPLSVAFAGKGMHDKMSEWLKTGW